MSTDRGCYAGELFTRDYVFALHTCPITQASLEHVCQAAMHLWVSHMCHMCALYMTHESVLGQSTVACAT